MARCPSRTEPELTENARLNTHATGRIKLQAHLAMLLFAMLIAGSFSLGGLAAGTLPSAAINALRYGIGILVMIAFGLVFRKTDLAPPKALWRFAILGALMATYMLTMFKALEFTSPVSTGAVFTLMPLMSAGFALVLLGQKTRPAVLASLVLAALGAVWVIFRGDIHAMLRFDIGRGEMIYFVGVVCHAAYAPLLRKFNRGESAFTFGLWGVIATGLFLFVPGIPAVAEAGLGNISAIAWIAIIYLAVFTTAVTFLLLQFASMRLPASKVLAYGYLTPTFIIVVEGLIGHGWVSLSVLAGAAVTACGLIIMAILPD